jgi:hypothetical protein
MDASQSRAALAAMSREERVALQKVVDRAVRVARNHQYCDTFNNILDEVLPEFVLTDQNGQPKAFASDDRSCNRARVEDLRPSSFDADGYDDHGYDRDGFNATGYNRQGYDAEGFTTSRDREGYYRTGYMSDGVYVSAKGVYTFPDREGNLRQGRPATAEEEAAEAAPAYNPTTWAPEGEDPPVFE